MAKSTHSGLRWLLWLREMPGGRSKVHFSKQISADLGYMNQFVSKRHSSDLVNHALFANINLHF